MGGPAAAVGATRTGRRARRRLLDITGGPPIPYRHTLRSHFLPAMRFGLLFSLVLAILAVIFALQNPQPMDVNLLFFETEGSTALVLILTFGFGVVVGLLSSLPGRIRARRELKALKKQQSTNQKNTSGSSSDAGTSTSPRSESSS